jgi:hypothetical protein
MSGSEFKTERDCLNAGGKWESTANRCEMGR